MAKTENVWTQWNNRSTRRSNTNEMKCNQPENRIRVLPNKDDSEVTFFPYVAHWIEMKFGKSIPVFHAADEKCPFCILAMRITKRINYLKNEESASEDDPRVKKLVWLRRKINGSRSFDMNVLDRNDYKTDKNEIKIKRFSAKPTIFNSICGLAASDEWGSPSDAETGYDLLIKVSKKANNAIFSEYTTSPAGRSETPLTEEEIEALNNYGYDLQDLREDDFTSEAKIDELLENTKLPLKKYIEDFEEDDAIIAYETADDDDTEVEIEIEKPKEIKRESSKVVVEKPKAKKTKVDGGFEEKECRGGISDGDDTCDLCDYRKECKTKQQLIEECEENGIKTKDSKGFFTNKVLKASLLELEQDEEPEVDEVETDEDEQAELDF